MRIPNSVISLNSKRGDSFVRLEPAYYALFYKQSHGPNSEGTSLLVEPLPEGADADARYRNVDSVEAEARQLMERFNTTTDPGRGARFFERVFPGGESDLRKAINSTIAEEAQRILRLKKALSPVAHKSWAKADVTEEWGIALQQAGFATRQDCIGKELVDLCRASITRANGVFDSIDIDLAVKLSQPDEAK